MTGTETMTDRPTYRLTILYDEDCEDPTEYMVGKVESWGDKYTRLYNNGMIEEEEVIAEYLEDPDTLALLHIGSGHGPYVDAWLFDPETDSGLPNGRIVWNGEDSERGWWAEESEEFRAEQIRIIVEQWKAWANGECFGYVLEEVTDCSECSQEKVEEVDSCFGFVGSDHKASGLEDHWHGSLPEGVGTMDVEENDV